MRSLRFLAAAMALSFAVGTPLLAHPVRHALLIDTEAVVRDLATCPPMPVASASDVAPSGLHTRAGRFYFTKDGADVGDRALMFDAGATTAREAKKAAPTSIVWLDPKDWEKQADPSKPVWIHYSRSKNCEPCRRADAMLQNDEVIYQSQFWNCVRIETSARPVPSDVFVTATDDASNQRTGATTMTATGAPATSKAYANRIYKAWRQLKGVK